MQYITSVQVLKPRIHSCIRRSGLRRSRYIGLDKTHLQHILIATALNFIRLGAWLSGMPFAQTRFSRFKQLQPLTA